MSAIGDNCIIKEVNFADELQKFLPADLPNRDEVIAKGARHLDLIAEANQHFNLTRIVSPLEAAIKHTVDSVIPWRLFLDSAKASARIVDAGSGAGFPGIPLAITLPDRKFVLLESTQKKARFIESAVAVLGLKNVEVYPVRAEDWLKDNRAGVVTARAVAPLSRAMPLFAAAMRKGARVFLYKGPDVDAEIEELPPKDRNRVVVLERYKLPESLGLRTLVELK